MWSIVTSLLGKNKIWGVATLVALLLFNGTMYIYNRYQEELKYHAWAGSIEAHRFTPSSTEYLDGYVRVYWEVWPKTAPCRFEEHYILHRIGNEPIGIYQHAHPYPKAMPYRVGTERSNINIKTVQVMGSWILVGRLDPGEYELEIHYKYDCWYYPDWSADQHIVFEVEDIDEE